MELGFGSNLENFKPISIKNKEFFDNYGLKIEKIDVLGSNMNKKHQNSVQN